MLKLVIGGTSSETALYRKMGFEFVRWKKAFSPANRWTSLLLLVVISHCILGDPPLAIAFSSSPRHPTSAIPTSSRSLSKSPHGENGSTFESEHRHGRHTSQPTSSGCGGVSITHPTTTRPGPAAPTISRNGRRRFLNGIMTGTLAATAAMMGGAAATAQPAGAAETATLGMGGVKISKRAGGLAQKIRVGVCFKMVTWHNRTYDAWHFGQFGSRHDEFSLCVVVRCIFLYVFLHSQDELQRDLMQERWDLVAAYPAQLRSFVPLFTTYTDAAFPSDLPSDYGLRVALRYEVGRYFASLERLKRAIAKQALDEAYTGTWLPTCAFVVIDPQRKREGLTIPHRASLLRIRTNTHP